MAGSLKIDLLDVGLRKYGDCVLVEFGNVLVLIDGAHTGDDQGTQGHDSIPAQLEKVLGHKAPFHVDLLMVSHAHEDHIGCLPALVTAKKLTAGSALVADPRLGWGRAQGQTPPDAVADERVQRAVAGLHEMPIRDIRDGRTVEEFLSDAASLEDNYKAMLKTLADGGTNVVSYVGPKDAKVKALVQKFSSIGMTILGPSQEQLLRCADKIRQGMSDAVDAAEKLLGTDAAIDAGEIYRRLASGESDAVDGERLGNMVNLQSIAAQFEFAGRKVLFAGDMQLAKPGTDEPKITAGVADLRTAIEKEAPYDFVKLSHHGSDNSVDEDLLKKLKTTKRYGICAGEQSTKHPNAQVLKMLASHQPALQWVRTDRNRRSTVTLTKTGATMEVETGVLNDAHPNSGDSMPSPAGPPTPAALAPVLKPRVQAAVGETGAAGFVEVVAKIPNERTRVQITIEIDPGGGGSPVRSILPGGQTSDAPLKIGSGRALPRLLAVTSRDALARNIGREEAGHVVDSLNGAGFSVLPDIPEGASVMDAASAVHRRLTGERGIEGVVIVGGFDVVPSLKLDALPPELRRQVAGNDDPDDFVVWSDEIYASTDGDTIADLPVSRVPDARSARFLFAALEASGRLRGSGRCGVRNVRREFADPIFRELPGDSAIFTSQPSTHDQQDPVLVLGGDLVYLMLHGDDRDGSRFWGEDTDGGREAVGMNNLPEASGGVVFTGCCWGALTADPPASRASGGETMAPRAPESSIALGFLGRGAVGFVGCTGAHYSPTQEPFDYYGGPMHSAFWKHSLAGEAPAKALHAAKREYAARIPHGHAGAISRAIEMKILRQYTCLGLGF
ncbi:MAG TPA: MBL fold metallo-hydrolase [Thermoanaerobaculia bacterium]|nr:MBL fold metallo-hydrolase [Thermoanaerobaculia bacterium]